MTVLDVVASTPWLLVGAVFALSLLVGSFLNVVIHRLPIMLDREWRQQATDLLTSSDSTNTSARILAPASSLQPPVHGTYNLVVPRSACPSCGAPITALQNIPVVSYLLLKGRCAGCKAQISRRYPVVELGTAILSAVVAWKFGYTTYTAAALLFTWMLIASSVIDIDHQILPDNLTLPLMWLGLLLSISGNDAFPTARDSVIGAAAGYLVLWLVYHLFKLITGKEGMGYGDFKLLAALGAWLGWQMLPLVILLSAASGAVIGIAMIVMRGRDRNIPLPFGPYLAIAGWIAMIWGERIVAGYLERI